MFERKKQAGKIYFLPIDHGVLPPTSLLREFLGGSSFSY